MIPRIMAQPTIPKRVDANKLVELNQQLNGEIDCKLLTRLESAVVALKGSVSCQLEFSRDKDRHRTMHGHCTATVVLECQRCMGEVEYQLDSTFDIGFVLNDDQARQLPKRLEPVEVDEDGQVQLLDVVEDELLLSLPEFPMHPIDECKAAPLRSEAPDVEAEKRENPFDVLAKLKQK